MDHRYRFRGRFDGACTQASNDSLGIVMTSILGIVGAVVLLFIVGVIKKK